MTRPCVITGVPRLSHELIQALGEHSVATLHEAYHHWA